MTIFNEGAYLTYKSIFHKALNLFKFDCEIMLKSVPRNQPVLSNKGKVSCSRKQWGPWWGSNPRPLHYEIDMQRTHCATSPLCSSGRAEAFKLLQCFKQLKEQHYKPSYKPTWYTIVLSKQFWDFWFIFSNLYRNQRHNHIQKPALCFLSFWEKQIWSFNHL